MSAEQPTTPPDNSPSPKFKLDYAPTNRAKCKVCSHTVDKEVLRLGISGSFRGKFSYAWRHWGCIKKEELEEIKQVGNLSEISGYGELLPEDQIRLSKAVEAGRISDEDVEEQLKKNNGAGEKTVEGSSKEEDDKRERKKSRKRKEIEEAEVKGSEESPGKKRKRAKGPDTSAEAPPVISKSTKATPKKPATSAEVVPDSEDDSPSASPKRKTKAGEEDTSRAKAKASPKKGKEKVSKASSAKEDVPMDVDENEEAPAPASATTKSKIAQKKPPAAAEDKKTTKQKPGPKPKPKETGSETAKSTKAKPKETAAKAAAKKSDKDASSEKPTTSKPKDTNSNPKADKAPKQLAPPKLQLTSDTSDHAAASPSPHLQPNAAAPIYVDLNSIADLLRGSSSHPSPAAHPTGPPPPRVALAKFCKKYKLSAALQSKLESLEINGPHVLRLIKDSALQSEGGLSVGELAGLRDAEERWLVDCRAGSSG